VWAWAWAWVFSHAKENVGKVVAENSFFAHISKVVNDEDKKAKTRI
jgi:hypothetical protein